MEVAPRKFSQELKDEAVRAVIDNSRTIASVAREYGLGAETLRNWVRRYRIEHAGEEPAMSEPERAELDRLRRENRELREQALFLKKAAAFFAKEQR